MSSSQAQPALFGTDGIRGEFGQFPLDEKTLRTFARSLAEKLLTASGAGSKVAIVYGGDTRASTPIIARWLAEELDRAGVDGIPIGTAPTPAIAWSVRATGASCGIAISASHNPHTDNGVKLFDSSGFKWTSAAEVQLEQRMKATGAASVVRKRQGSLPAPRHELTRQYLASLEATLGPDRSPLAGLRVAVDAANGAASEYARQLFEQLGARVTSRFDRPDGHNINNDCGSTHPQKVADLTIASSSNLGVSFDGDADRVIVADERGVVHDGDALLFLWARHLASEGRLPGHRIVATSMSNIGLERALAKFGLELVRCDVGDRAVVETMVRDGIVLGGEQSGHIVHLESGTTGDGMATALRIASLVADKSQQLSTLLSDFVRYPQLIENVPVRHKPPLDGIPAIVEHQHRIEQQLGDRGRLVLRYSGTESLVRIMIEGEDAVMISELAAQLAKTLKTELS